MKTKITNTERFVEENPQAALLKMMSLGPSSFVESMEAEGQQELVAQTSVLPAQGSEAPCWSAMGVIFGEVVDGDPLFRCVVLPAGWVLKPTKRSMHSSLVDALGRTRGRVFYKAAHYDRRARLSACTRFSVEEDWEGGNNHYFVKDEGEIIFTSVPGVVAADASLQEKADAGKKPAIEWLTSKYPDYANPAAYWDK